MLEERELEENSQYLFHVIASNDVGAIQSAPVQISKYNTSLMNGNNCCCLVTTNVQDIDISKKEDTYFIQCIYLSGSDVSGCVYILMSGKEGVKNVTGFIERDSNGLEVANIGCYSEVLAHENITDVLPVSKIINTIIDTCTNGKQFIIVPFDPLTFLTPPVTYIYNYRLSRTPLTRNPDGHCWDIYNCTRHCGGGIILLYTQDQE